MKSSVNGEATAYVTDPESALSQLLTQTHADGSSIYYVYGNGLISQEHFTPDGEAEYRVFHYDYRGSTEAMTNLEGRVTDRVTYDPYGKITSRTGDTDTIFLYVGQWGVQTDGSGLLYMRARYYSTDLNRFINEDPIKDGLNWYTYANNNPITMIDAEGLASKKSEYAAFIAEGGALLAQAADLVFKPSTVEIAPWLIGYNGKPRTSGGRSVTYSFEDRQKLEGEIIDWYSYENRKGPNRYVKPYLTEGEEFNDEKYGEGVLTDKYGRYGVALGPKVLDPDYPDDGDLTAGSIKDYIGSRVDVVLYNTKEDKYAYIECVFIGHLKGHTFDNGVYQTGHPYPDSTLAETEPYNKKHADGSIVEFTGMEPSSNGSMSAYIVTELLVYPK